MKSWEGIPELSRDVGELQRGQGLVGAKEGRLHGHEAVDVAVGIGVVGVGRRRRPLRLHLVQELLVVIAE